MRFENIINHKLGIGDIGFFIAIAPLFSPILFSIVYVFGLSFSLFVHLITRQDNKQTIPLAGFFSVFLILVLIASRLSGHVLCDDDNIIQLISF
jgi:hypothetical protein